MTINQQWVSKMNYIILLPPSEGKNIGGKYKFICENENTLSLISKIESFIKNKSEIEIEKLFELKAKKLEEAVKGMSNIFNEKTLPAIERYSGVMFKAISYSNLDNLKKENFDNSVIFIDGLFGAISPNTMIPSYKLKISSKIGELNVSKFWKEKLFHFFKNKFKDKIIIDLLPIAHRKVVNYSSAKEVYKINFFDKKSDLIYKNVGHNSKKLKGELIRYICDKINIDEKYLKEFIHQMGYKFNKELSNKSDEINFSG